MPQKPHKTTPVDPATSRCVDCLYYVAMTSNTVNGLCHVEPPVNGDTYGYPLVVGATDYCKYGEK